MRNVEIVKNLCNVARFVVNGYLQSQNAKIQKYQNIHHILTDENEVLIPSTEESYSFDERVWNIHYIEGYIVLTKKEKKRK